MGILEQIAADVAEIKSLLLAGAAAGATAAPAADKAKDKPAPKPKAADKAADKPTFTAEQLRDKFLAVQAKHGDADTKALIAELGYDKLAKLIADTANWQKSWDKAEEKLAEEASDDDDNGGL